MHLNKLSMRNFKKYRRADIQFQDGLTGIIGSNGAGKSTVVEAIAWALYGSRASTIKRDYLKNTRSGESDGVEVRLHLGWGMQEVEVRRAMKGRALTPEADLFIDGKKVAAGTRDVDERLEAMLKISYQDFMKTFFARQKDLDNLLKEGGTGKREYLLKLLGLDEIKEAATERIRSERSSLEEKKNALAGALAEIGDVAGMIELASTKIASARDELSVSANIEAKAGEAVDKMRLHLDLQAERKRRHDLLAANKSSLESQASEKRRAISFDEKRLKEIQVSKKLLAEMEPGLSRLREVRSRLEILEPKRRDHDEIARKIAAARAGREGMAKNIRERETRLSTLIKDKSALDDLAPLESEYSGVQERFACMEKQRDEHSDLQTGLNGERIRLDSQRERLSKVSDALALLDVAVSRLKEIEPLKEEQALLQAEMKALDEKRERRREANGLDVQRKTIEERISRLKAGASALRRDIEALGNIEKREAEIHGQEKAIDSLLADMNNEVAEMKKEQGARISAKTSALEGQIKIRGLGAEGSCPTCERPLGEQHGHLVRKYEDAVAAADKACADISERIRAQMEKIASATKARSGLNAAFEEINASKRKRAELSASLRGLEVQIGEAARDIKAVLKAVKGLGDVDYDPMRHAEVRASIEKIQPRIEEYHGLIARLQERPARVAERDGLLSEIEGVCERIRVLEGRVAALGFSEDEYSRARKRLSDLKPHHDRFLALRERVRGIPEVEEAIASQRKEIAAIDTEIRRLGEEVAALSFDPSEHEALSREARALSKVQEEYYRVSLLAAAEPEILSRLAESRSAIDALLTGIAEAVEGMKAIGYSPEEHEGARSDLAASEAALDAARKSLQEKKVELRLVEEELSRLRADLMRKEELEGQISATSRSIEVADSARSLINRFMDQVLVRVKDDIARSAGDILDDVSGKYSLLKIDDDFNIMVEDGGEFYPISRYSGGEVDMIAVSVRVAISEYLMRFSNRDGPGYSFLILDEIFGSQDQEHREKMINVLRSLEERFPQIIAISHISDVQGQFDNTINVVEDDMGNSRVEVS